MFPPASADRPDVAWPWWLLLAGMAVAPLSTKVAGAAWVLLCLFGLWAAWRRPRPAGADDAAARAWLTACGLGLVFEVVARAFWHDPWDELHAPIRLALAAAATLALRRRFAVTETWRRRFADAVALACVAALGLALWKGADRSSYPTNVIPWAVAMGFLVCLLLPRTVDAACTLRRRLLWSVAALAGVVAIVLSQTRGAYGVLAWIVLFCAGTVWRRRRVTRHGVGIAIAVALVLVAGSLLLPRAIQTSVERARLAVSEFEQAAEGGRPGDGANSSVGARIYLWRMAARSFAQSPLIGVGEVERNRRIQEVGAQTHSPIIQGLAHVHNQYLNSAMDHGLLGLAAVLAWMVGLAVAVARVDRLDTVARWQLSGLLFMHMTGSLTNTNFAHTYYGIMLALCVSLVLLTAKDKIAAGSLAGDPAREP